MEVKSESEVAQSCPTLRDPMDCSLPGSSVHGIFQARVLEWGAIAFSTLSSSMILRMLCVYVLLISFNPSCILESLGEHFKITIITVPTTKHEESQKPLR